MNLELIKNKMTQSFGRTGLVVQKHSPEILLGLGIIGGVAAAIMAVRATSKLNNVLIEIEEERAEVELQDEDGNFDQTRYNKELAVHYVKTGLRFTKLYGPSIGVGVLSIASILSAHGIMANRQVGLVSAYTLLHEGYKAYRQRVIEELGEDKDYDFYHGLKNEEVTISEEDPETGKTKKVKRTIKVADPRYRTPSIYSRFFDETCRAWKTDPLLNRAFLTSQERYLNDILILRGHVFLNEMYEALGMDWTPEGQLVGWVLKGDPEDMKTEGRDGYISFRMFDPANQPNVDFVNGHNPSILIDPNVDGIIYDLI